MRLHLGSVRSSISIHEPELEVVHKTWQRWPGCFGSPFMTAESNSRPSLRDWWVLTQTLKPRRETPEFPVELGGIHEPHAAFLTENRTRNHGRCRFKEIRGLGPMGAALQAADKHDQ